MIHSLVRACGAAVLALGIGTLVASCGGGGGGALPAQLSSDSPAATSTATPAAAAAPAAAQAATKTCAQLASASVAAGAIGLPNGGAAVSSAVPMPAGGTGAAAYGAYCLVSGDILPVDPAAPNIKFQLALPESWNGKALMLGGSGFDGSIPPLSDSSTLWGSPKAVLPLGRGYAVFGSDSGHQAQSGVPPGAFGSNPEALKNYAGDALKKTRDVAVALIGMRYGKAPSKSYFLGYSKGGGEALAVTQRWPADWDGVVAGAPGWNVTAVSLQMLAATQAVAVPGAWLDPAKRGLLFNAALAACDGLDGANDGVVSNVRACELVFDPATATYNGAPLRCPNGADTGDTCLSDVQIAALKKINEPSPLSYTLASGEASLPGFPVYIADNGGGTGSDVLKATMSALGVFGAVAPAFPPSAAMSSAWQQADGFIRYVVLGDPGFDALTMNLQTADGLASRFELASALDADIADISPFMNRGGKLIIWQGTQDMLISPRATEFFYSRMQAAMGPANVDSFVRYYQLPGSQHGPSSVFQAEWDQLTAIENWVEKGQDPGSSLVVSDDVGVPGRTRPMCAFPYWPRYLGSGDINSASSYVCAAS